MGTAVDSITGLIAPVVAAGTVMKVTDAMFGTLAKNSPKKKVQRKRKSKKSCKGKNSKCKQTKKMHKGIKGQTALPKGHKTQGDLFQAVFGHPVIKG
jgi:hypothetical protein